MEKKNLNQETARRREEGMTLVEIMIVVIIMAMIATGVTVAVLPALGDAKSDLARSNVGAIKSAAEMHLLRGRDCPGSVDELVEARRLPDSTETNDPWGTPYSVQCSGQNIVVTSAGEDGEFDTEDDVSTARR